MTKATSIPFQYDLENPVSIRLELKFQAKFYKIVDRYDSLTLPEEADAVKILMGKINIPTAFNLDTRFQLDDHRLWRSPPTVNDFLFVLMACFEDARRAKARSVYYKYTVTENSETVTGTPRLYLSKTKTKPIQSNTPVKHRVLQQSLGVNAHFAAKTIILMPNVVLEPLSSPRIRTVLISVRGPWSVSQSRWSQGKDSQLQRT